MGYRCAKRGVTRWLLFLVNCLLVAKRVKTSRGAGCEPSARAPLRSKSDALPWRGGRGEDWLAELFTRAGSAVRKLPLYGIILVAALAYRRDCF
jgi:hypothetical protein